MCLIVVFFILANFFEIFHYSFDDQIEVKENGITHRASLSYGEKKIYFKEYKDTPIDKQDSVNAVIQKEADRIIEIHKKIKP